MHVKMHGGKSVCQSSGRLGFNPKSNHTKNQKKWFLVPPYLTLRIIRYRLRVSGAIQG